MGKLHFEITADDSSFQRKVQAVEASVKSAQQQIERSGQGIDTAFRSMTGKVEQQAGAIEAAFKRAFADAETMKLSELKSSIKTQVIYLKELEQKYKDVSAAVQGLKMSPKKTEMQGTLKNLKTEIDEEKAALDGLRAKYSDMTSGSVESFRMKLMQITNQLMAMRLAGEQNTQEYRELEQEMGLLATIMREVQQTRFADSTGATQWHGMIQGVQGLMGAYSVGSGIVGMFTKDQEKLMLIQTKMQSVMGVLMGMQQLSNTLHSTSTFRLRTLKAATDLWNAANTKAAAGLRVLGVSAGVANVAAKALMATLSLGLSVAIGAVIGLLNKLAAKHAEARKKAEESAKAQQEAFEKYADAVSGKSSGVLSKFEALRQKYVKLGDDLKAREKFIEDNADAFNELGVQVRNVHDADNLFINNTEAFKQAVMIRAQALAGEELAAEKYKEAIQKIAEADGMMWRVSGTKARYAGLSQEQQKQAQDRYRTAYNDYIEENYTSKLAGKSTLERAALVAQKKEIERAAQETGNTAAQSYIEGLKTELSNEAGRLEADAAKLITASLDLSEDARAKLRKAGIREVDGKGSKKDASDKQASDLAKMQRDLTNKATQARIDAMEEGLEKELAQIQYDYDRKRDLIAEEEKKLKAAQGGTLTAEQQSALDEVTHQNEAARQRAVAKAYRAEFEAMQEHLRAYGTYQQQKLAIAEVYAEKVRKASSEGERRRLGVERDSLLAGVEARELKANIDWSVVFGEFGSMFHDLLAPELEKAKAYTRTDEFQNADHDSQEALLDAIRQMEQSLGGAGEVSFRQLGAEVIAYRQSLAELQRAQVEYESTYVTLTAAQHRYLHAVETGTQEELEIARNALYAARTNAEAAAENVSSMQSVASEAQRSMTDTASRLRSSMDGVVEGLRQIASGSLSGAYEGLIKFGNSAEKMGGKLGASFGKVADALEDVPIVGWILSILDVLKDGLSDLVGGLLDAIFSAVSGIISDVLSGDLLATVGKSLINGISGIFDALTFGGFSSWFDSSNAKEVQKTIDRLTDRNEHLQTAIETLTDEIKASRGTKSVEAYREAYKYQQETNANYLDIARAQAGYHGAHHSWNAFWGGFSREQITKLSEQIGRRWDGDIFSLSPEEMKQLRANVDMWTQLQNTGKGDYGSRLTVKLDDYIEQAGKLEELTDQLYEGLTGISFDSMYGSFVDKLMDMKYDAKAAAEDISEYFMRAMLSNQIGEMYSDKLRDWWEKFGKAMEDNELTEEERKALADEYMGYVNEAIKLRDNLAAATGYSSDDRPDAQAASRGGFQAMSQDTVSELNGRFTDIQGKVNLLVSGMDMLRSINQQTCYTTLDIRDIAIQLNGNVADIRAFTQYLPEMNERLGKINRKLDEI